MMLLLINAEERRPRDEMEKNKEALLMKSRGYIGTKRLVADRPDWIEVVEECLKTSDEAQRYNGEFPGARVWKVMKEKNKYLFPNLKPLVTYGILRKTDSSRGGRRAYYVMPDRNGVRRALTELNEEPGP